MSHDSYDEKLQELEAPTPVFMTFVISMGLIGAGLALVQFIL